MFLSWDVSWKWTEVGPGRHFPLFWDPHVGPVSDPIPLEKTLNLSHSRTGKTIGAWVHTERKGAIMAWWDFQVLYTFSSGPWTPRRNVPRGPKGGGWLPLQEGWHKRVWDGDGDNIFVGWASVYLVGEERHICVSGTPVQKAQGGHSPHMPWARLRPTQGGNGKNVFFDSLAWTANILWCLYLCRCLFVRYTWNWSCRKICCAHLHFQGKIQDCESLSQRDNCSPWVPQARFRQEGFSPPKWDESDVKKLLTVKRPCRAQPAPITKKRSHSEAIHPHPKTRCIKNTIFKTVRQHRSNKHDSAAKELEGFSMWIWEKIATSSFPPQRRRAISFSVRSVMSWQVKANPFWFTQFSSHLIEIQYRLWEKVDFLPSPTWIWSHLVYLHYVIFAFRLCLLASTEFSCRHWQLLILR